MLRNDLSLEQKGDLIKENERPMSSNPIRSNLGLVDLGGFVEFTEAVV